MWHGDNMLIWLIVKPTFPTSRQVFLSKNGKKFGVKFSPFAPNPTPFLIETTTNRGKKFRKKKWQFHEYDIIGTTFIHSLFSI